MIAVVIHYLWRFRVNFPWKTRCFRDPVIVICCRRATVVDYNDHSIFNMTGPLGQNRAFADRAFGESSAQPAPKYHTKGCSRSSVDSPGARTLVFAAFIEFFRGRPPGGDNFTSFSKCSRPFLQSVKSTLSDLKSCNPVGGTPSSTA